MKTLNNVSFTRQAFAEYTYWQTQDRKTLKQINRLIKDILRHPFTGLGKPEPLQYELAKSWSRRIDHTNQLVYQVSETTLYIIQCQYHDDNKN